MAFYDFHAKESFARVRAPVRYFLPGKIYLRASVDNVGKTADRA